MSPILSLCIPTYNRCNVLKKTLERIASYKSFDAEVELVISDNCSTDSTREVCEFFTTRYENVKYYRNDSNIQDENFVKVLDCGSGEYLKLMNDWFYPTDEGLSLMKRAILENLQHKIPLFFTSNWIAKKDQEIIKCNNLNEYVQAVSVMVTSNNLFGAWKKDWESISNKERFSNLKLSQVDWTYNIVEKKGCLLYNAPVLISSREMRKTIRKGFNFFDIMLKNYYTIMQYYVDQNLIYTVVMEDDKKEFLKHFRPELFQSLICNTSRYWKYETSGSWRLLFKFYRNKPYFYFFIITLPFQWLFHASVRDFWK